MKARQIFVYAKILALVICSCLILSGCASTSGKSKIKLGPSPTNGMTGFQLIDGREKSSLVYSEEGGTQYFGDNNFEVPPMQLISVHFSEKLGGMLKGRDVTVLHFRVRITNPEPQTYGMPIGTALIGSALKLPQLGFPHYAGVSLRCSYQQQEFTGDSSVEFYIGSGESEISEAFNAAVNKATEKLRALLIAEAHKVN